MCVLQVPCISLPKTESARLESLQAGALLQCRYPCAELLVCLLEQRTCTAQPALKQPTGTVFVLTTVFNCCRLFTVNHSGYADAL